MRIGPHGGGARRGTLGTSSVFGPQLHAGPPRRRGPRRSNRNRRPHRRHWLLFSILTIVLCAATLLGVLSTPASAPSHVGVARRSTTAIAHSAHVSRPPQYGWGLAPPSRRVPVHLKLPLSSGLLFDVRTGKVRWRRRQDRVLPIASLTKMMTALIVAAHSQPGARVPITPQAVHFTGSGVGLLPLGKRVPLVSLLYGLLLPSGNDAAIALAQHVAGTQSRFVELMNQKARSLGLRCTHFASPSGIVDRENHSCVGDLAILAHLMLKQPLLARIVSARSAILPFPIKGGKLYLYNNNPLLVMRYPGTDGVKTGYTDAAGTCLVATARRGRAWYGVVLLHSANIALQAETLLNAAFAQDGG